MLAYTKELLTVQFQYPADKRKRFSNENLADLSENLDALLVAPSDSGSRMSRISRPGII